MWKQKLRKISVFLSFRFSARIFTPQRNLLSPFSQISLKCMDRARPWTHWRSSCIKTRTSRSISPCALALPPCKDRQRFRMKREINVFPCYSACYFYCYWKCTNCFLFLFLSLIRGEGYFHLILYTLNLCRHSNSWLKFYAISKIARD